MFIRGRISKPLFIILFLALLVPTMINETKGTCYSWPWVFSPHSSSGLPTQAPGHGRYDHLVDSIIRRDLHPCL